MKFSIRLMILGLGLVNGMTAASADVYVDGQVIQEADISSISIDPISGDVTIAAGGLYTVTRDGDPPPGPQVVINSLTASPSTITEGQSTTISWTTTDADSCTPSGGTGGWDQQSISLPSGSFGPITISAPATYVFTLNCENATPTTAQRNVTVVVNPDVPPPAGDACPEGYVSPLSGFDTTWADHFGFQWPAPTYAEVLTNVPRAGYISLQFNSDENPGMDGGVSTTTHTSTSGRRRAAISHCPGDFSEHLPDTFDKCTEVFFIGGGLNWSTEVSPASWECELQPNTTYYLNLTFTDGEDPATDECTSDSTCRTILRAWK